MSSVPSLVAWESEPDPVDEREFTPGCPPGWHGWNAWSPEVEVCELLAELTATLRPRRVVETGTGQGYVSRRIAQQLGDGQSLTCFESGEDWRASLRGLTFFDGGRHALADGESPDEGVLATADLCLLDSDFAHRYGEIQRWWRSAPPGSVLFVHDAGNPYVDEPQFARTRATIEELGIPGIFLGNPRGGFLGQRPPTTDARLDAGGLANRLAEVERQLRELRATKTVRYTARARAVVARLRRRRSR